MKIKHLCTDLKKLSYLISWVELQVMISGKISPRKLSKTMYPS